MKRFKIDFTGRDYDPFGLYVAKRGWFGTKWWLLGRFETKEKADALYNLIKDLPEYLE